MSTKCSKGVRIMDVRKRRGPGRPLRRNTAIRERMDDLGMRPSELAANLELSLPQTYRIIGGGSQPSPTQARVLQIILGLTLEEVYRLPTLAFE